MRIHHHHHHVHKTSTQSIAPSPESEKLHEAERNDHDLYSIISQIWCMDEVLTSRKIVTGSFLKQYATCITSLFDNISHRTDRSDQLNAILTSLFNQQKSLGCSLQELCANILSSDKVVSENAQHSLLQNFSQLNIYHNIQAWGPTKDYYHRPYPELAQYRSTLQDIYDNLKKLSGRVDLNNPDVQRWFNALNDALQVFEDIEKRFDKTLLNQDPYYCMIRDSLNQAGIHGAIDPLDREWQDGILHSIQQSPFVAELDWFVDYFNKYEP